MLRKLSFALAAAAALGTAALAPTSASAWGFHGGWHNGYNSYDYDSYGHRGFGHDRRR